MRALIMPMLGLMRRIQETVIKTPGMMMRAKVIIPMKRANGVLVRSTTQARNRPPTKARAVEVRENHSVLMVASTKAALAQARA